MTAQRLLAKLQLQSQAASEHEYQQRKYEAAHPMVTADMIEDQKISQISNMRKKTAEAHFQLELDRQLEAESKKNLAATMRLRESRLTPAERKAREEETRRGQILFSRVIKELHPDWKRQAQEEFNAKKL